MQLVLDGGGPGLTSAWGRERRWHGPVAAVLIHGAIALLWLAWPTAPAPVLEDQVVELVLAPPPAPAPAPVPPAPAVQPAAATPVVKPALPRPAPAAKAAPAAAIRPVAEAPATSAPATSAPAAPAAETAQGPHESAPSEPDLSPNPTEAPRPVYPRAARQRGWQGVVMVLVQVAADGVPLGVAVKASSGHSLLDEAALEAVKRWRFSPARQNGRPVTAAVEVPVRFSLEG